MNRTIIQILLKVIPLWYFLLNASIYEHFHNGLSEHLDYMVTFKFIFIMLTTRTIRVDMLT